MRLPTVENKVNWTTLAVIFSICATVGGMVYSHGQFTQRMDSNERAQDASNARTDAKIEQLSEDNKKLENLTYRMTLVEQNHLGLTRTLDNLNASISAQGADIRVIREILNRIDPKAPAQ